METYTCFVSTFKTVCWIAVHLQWCSMCAVIWCERLARFTETTIMDESDGRKLKPVSRMYLIMNFWKLCCLCMRAWMHVHGCVLWCPPEFRSLEFEGASSFWITSGSPVVLNQDCREDGKDLSVPNAQRGSLYCEQCVIWYYHAGAVLCLTIDSYSSQWILMSSTSFA